MSADKRFGNALPESPGFVTPRPAPGMDSTPRAFGSPPPGGAGELKEPVSPPAPPGALGRPGHVRPPGGSVDRADGPVSAPVVWLAVAGLLELVAVVLAAVADARPVLSAIGWLLAGFGAIGSLAWFTVEDTRRSTDRWYSRQDWPGLVRAGLILGAVLVVAADSYRFADWAARQ